MLATWGEGHWGQEAEAYVTLVADDQVGVAVLGQRPVNWDGSWRAFPVLADRLAAAEPGWDAERRASTARTLGLRSTALTRSLLTVSGYAASRQLLMPAAARLPGLFRAAVAQLADGR